MKSLIFTVALVCFPICLPISSPSLAATRYVDGSVSASGDGTSWDSPFNTIQEGIDAASNGETVLVAEGTYVENIRFNGKNIALTSTDPLDSTVVANTIIDGNQAGSVVSFSGAETETCVFSGFTVRNGSAERGGGICGGTHEKRGLASITDNVISHNSVSVWGGGIAYCDGMIQNNLIAFNSAGEGGAGLYYCGGTIRNNLIVGNFRTGGYIVHGGGLCFCDGLIENNTIAGNSADEAAGLYSCKGTIRNCIIWGNVAPRGEQTDHSSTPSYSCIQFWDGDGEGNLDYNPHFANAASGDYHLLSWSPCIDGGDPASPFSLEPEPHGERIDMGAYGNTPEATSKSLDTDADGLPDEWERAVFGDLIHDGQGDPDNDRCVNLQEYHRGTSPTGADLWYVDCNVPASGDGRTWATAFRTIQEGIDAASEDETVIVAQGTYFENIEFEGKNITLQSTDPLDAGVVEQTVIDGSAAGSVVVLSATESPACVVSGFTICNGEATRGAGICGGGINDHTRATVQRNLIANTRGEGIAFCDGLIEDNRILGNRSGLHDCDGVIRHNLISGNGVPSEGLGVGAGGLSHCDGTIQGNIISENCAGLYGGGGLHDCDGTIIGNLIAGNSANSGGGLALCSGFIVNNTVVGNVAVESGSFYGEGGGLYGCNGTIRNCIVWGNVAKTGPELASSSVPAYSCVRFWSGGGVGNTAHYPYFVDAGKGDYHLKNWSPCIDAGDPASPFSLEPQPNGARIDMGAYGNTLEATAKSSDSDHDGLPDDWEMHFLSGLLQDANGDVDGDGLSNAEEFDQGSNPSGRPAWHVDASASSPGDGKTWETAFATVQEGIDAAQDGDIVMVAEGTYYENIVFSGNNVTLTSVDPLHSPVVAGTILDGGQSGSVVTFLGTEDPVCVVAGFTIRNGSADLGGGIHGFRTHATIEHNLITENSAYRGGGLAYCDGVIRRNTILGNTASGLAPKGVGAGLYRCNGTVQGNRICRNVAVESGGGLYDCDGAVRNNLIIENSGGIAGLSLCDGTIENNTVANNVGGGISSITGTIRNCIVWGNAGPEDQDVYSEVDPTYCCIQRWSGGGEGNTHHYPYFVDAGNGDYHLRTYSPCIDAGDPSSPFSQEPEPNGGRVNMGAYGNTQEATSKSPDADQDGLPDDWEIEHFESLVQGPNEDPDADGIPNLREYYRGFDPNVPATSWHVDGAVTASGDGTSWATAFKTVQEAIDAASDGDWVIVAAGTYAETINLRGKNIFLRSTDPLNPTVVASTVLTPGTGPSIVTFAGTEDENCVVEGFTIQNGSATWGGGIFGGSMDYPTHATIQNNVITNNYEGGGIAYCDGLIQHNIIKENSPGGLWYCDGVIRHNTITKNTANGLSRCNGIIENNRIESNLYTAITGCIATIRNNVICNHLGAGLSYCDGVVENNTICNNGGYGLEECSGIIRNCIVWGNPMRLSEGTIPTYSCIEGWMEGGLGNISYFPHFVNVDSGDYHLASWSPCIDAGDPASAFSEEPEPNGGRVDMGSYGNTPEATSKSLDTDMDGLPDDWEGHFFGNLVQVPGGDFDEDFVLNLQEYLLGSDPTGGPPLLYVDRSVTSSGNGTSWQTAFRTIQEGISASTDGHAVVVAEGTYPEQIHFHGKRIRLRSTDPLDPVVVANTIIAAAKGGRVVTFAGTEDETCVLSGFTIRNGKAPYGGGICGGTPTIHARATIEHNVITGNSATGDSACGGGIAFCDGRIQGNVIVANMATGQNANGGGLGCCHGLIQNNVIGENFAEGEGGGLFDCDSVIRGNTISMNSALSGGGLAGCDGMVKNCIIWGSLPMGADGELYLSSVPSFSCIEEWTGGGKGNISKIARFVAPESRDFRLGADSPCIDAGSNDPDLPATDMVGMHRVMFGRKSLTVDMGAYEFYINRLDAVPGTNEALFTWSSLANKTYSIFYTDDLFNWHTAIDNFPSSGNQTTSWTDDGSLTRLPPLLAPRRFYRTLENP